MKRFILLTILACAFASGCQTTARTTENVEVYASWRPVSEDAEIVVKYSAATR